MSLLRQIDRKTNTKNRYSEREQSRMKLVLLQNFRERERETETRNNTKRDRNGLAGYDYRPCMAGKFPQKRHICACRHKGVRRDSGG